MTNFNVLFEELIRSISEKVSENIISSLNSSAIIEESTFLDISETAVLINLKVPTIYGLVHRNKIPYIKKGKKLYFVKEDILQWIKSGKQKTKSELELKADEYLAKNRFV
jgi:excisionase family DNA binding protein